MSDLYSRIPFSELLKNIIDNRGRTCPPSKSGIPLIATNCIKNENLYPVFEKVRYVSQDVFDNWFRGHPEPGDMIFVNKGTPGRTCWVPNPLNFCIAQDMIAIRADEKKIYPKYLFAALRSVHIQGEIENLHVGTLIPHFKKSDFHYLKIPVPPPNIQNFIGDLYFNLSLKIDLLHRQHKTIEQLAEALFRKWFVEEAENGGKVGKLGDVLELVYGKTLKQEIRTGIGFPVVGSSGIVGYHSEYLVEKPGIVIGRKGTLGKVNYMFENFTPIDTTYYVKSKANSIGLFYEYFLLKTLNLEEMNSDSAVPGLNRDIALSIEIKVSPLKIIEKFNYICSSLFAKIDFNSNQIRTLTKLRDTLIPKLMRGEIRLKNLLII